MARFGSWGSLIAAYAVVMACAPASEGFGDGSATQAGVGDTTDGGMSSMESADGPTSSAEGNGSGGGSQGDSTGTSASGGESDGESDGDSEGDGPEPMDEEEEIGRADFEGCDEPLWCFTPPDILDPAGGAMWMQECFRAEMEPPFELVEIEAVIRGMSVQLSSVEVQIYERASDGPTTPDPIASQMVPVGDLSIGPNTIAIDPPVMLDEREFCIGLAAPNDGLGGSLGVAVNPESTQPNVSFFRLRGDPGCWFPEWTEIISLGPDPTGNWCIGGTIVK